VGIRALIAKNAPADRPDPTGSDRAAVSPASGLARPGSLLVQRLLEVGVDGKGAFDSAAQVARDALDALAVGAPREHAIDAVVSDHVRLAAAGGFVTGLGGFATMAVALPANVAGFYLIATRMSAAIAVIRGYDVSDPQVRTAVLLSLVGADSHEVLRKAGYAGTGRLANLAVQRLPGPVLMAVNKGIGFRLINQIGRKSLARLGRAVPVAGGVLGAGLDVYLLRKIAEQVRGEFPAQAGGLPAADGVGATP
jgi:hypothetical protein